MEEKNGIMIILNGHFRTGSTMLWSIFKKSNPYIFSFYEPFHPQIFKDVIMPLREFRGDYKKLNKNTIKKLRKHHKIVPKVISFEKWEDYLDILNSLKKPVFLQPNRASLILKKINKKYGSKIIHIIRNPLDSLVSFGILEYKNKKRLNENFVKRMKKDFKRFLKSIKLIYQIKNFSDYIYLLKFYLEKLFNKTAFIPSNFYFKESYALYVKKGLLKKDKKHDDIDKFLLVWAELNYRAKKQIESLGKEGICIYYEDIVSNSEEEFKKLEKFSNLKINKKLIKVRKDSFRNFPKKTKRYILYKIRKNGIEKKVKYFMGKWYKKIFNFKN